MKKILFKIDTLLGNPIIGFYEYLKLKKRFKYFNNQLHNRSDKYPTFKFSKTEVVTQLEENGYIVLKNFLDVDVLKKIKNDFDIFLNSGSNLLPVSNDLIRAKNDLSPAKVFLSKDDLNKGQAFCRNYTNNMVLKDPLLYISEISNIALIKI